MLASLNPLIARWQENLRGSLWFVPATLSLLAGTAAVFLTTYEEEVDSPVRDLVPWLFEGDGEAAAAMMAAIAGSIITVAGVVFSVTVVALTLASTQFSPRILRNFMRDRVNQVVLGGFLATFTYCLAVLRSIQANEEFVPEVAVTVGVGLAFISLGLLILFMHHIAQSVQVANILQRITAETIEQVPNLFPAAIGGEEAFSAPAIVEEEDPARVRSSRYGYVQLVDDGWMLDLAARQQLIMRLDAQPGDFVSIGASLASIWPADSLDNDLKERLDASFLLDNYPSLEHDVEFGIRQVVDIAVKALSPAINDPTTATNAIDHLGVILGAVSRRSFPSPFRRASDGEVRVIAYGPTLEHMLRLAFDQIRHYGRGDRRVLTRILDTLAELRVGVNDSKGLNAIAAVAEQVARAGERGLEDDADRRLLREHARSLLEPVRPARPRRVWAGKQAV